MATKYVKMKNMKQEELSKFLFIDDNVGWLAAMGRALRGNQNVFFAECTSVEDAIRAIDEYKPDVIFLDHNLSTSGDDGFAVLDGITNKNIKVYSTTSDSFVAQEYLRRGIGHVNKRDLAGFKSIISGHESE